MQNQSSSEADENSKAPSMVALNGKCELLLPSLENGIKKIEFNKLLHSPEFVWKLAQPN